MFQASHTPEFKGGFFDEWAYFIGNRCDVIHRFSEEFAMRSLFHCPRHVLPRLEHLEDRTLMSTCHVTRLTDQGVGKGFRGDLRYCINKVNTEPGPDAIDFTVTGTINLTGALPDVSTDIDIQGPGANLLTIRRDAGGDYRCFTVAAGTVLISGVTIADGRADVGGGIYNQSNLSLNDVILSTNTSVVGQGGGIYNGGVLTLSNTTISDNNSHSPVFHVGPDYGGGIYNSILGQMNITTSTFNNNSADGDWAGSGGAIANYGFMTISDTTFYDNSARGDYPSSTGGGPGGYGGAIFNSGVLNVLSSTFQDNTAIALMNVGGHRALGGGIYNGDTLTVVNSTFFGNSSTGFIARAGGIYEHGIVSTVRHSTLDNNSVEYSA